MIKSQKGFSGGQVLGIVLLAIVVTAGVSYWLLSRSAFGDDSGFRPEAPSGGYRYKYRWFFYANRPIKQS